ncbi:DNA translocase FtsK 4TM domain-containing protein [Halomonas sp. E19]|uniref:DNA translocase FtsK 4TM domain-containing protein n=1 Tax=Halomonas sp. E19 TaxID=3397247 RepID=UPI0040333F13
MGLHLHGAAREGATIILLAGCVFLLLALFSYTPADPGWSHRGPETDVANWMGPIGAWLADVLYSLFGASALWWPGMLGYASWWMIRTRRASIDWDATAAAVRLGGLVLLLLGTTTLGALHFYSPQSVLPYSSGGILGEGLVGALVPLVDSGGTGLLALAAMLCGFPLFTGVSWFTVMDELGHRMLRLWRWAATPFGLVRERYEARHEAHEPGLGDGSEAQEAEEVQEEDAYDEPVSRRPRRWAFWRRKAVEPAVPHAQREPGMSSAFGADGDTQIPWDVVEQTPRRSSRKRPMLRRTRRPIIALWAPLPRALSCRLPHRFLHRRLRPCLLRRLPRPLCRLLPQTALLRRPPSRRRGLPRAASRRAVTKSRRLPSRCRCVPPMMTRRPPQLPAPSPRARRPRRSQPPQVPNCANLRWPRLPSIRRLRAARRARKLPQARPHRHVASRS